MPASTHSRGLAAELLAQLHFVQEGCGVYVPLMGQSRADLVVDRGGRLLKVQVKAAGWASNERGLKEYERAVIRPYLEGDWDLLLLVGEDGAVFEYEWEAVKSASAVYTGRQRQKA